MFFTNLFRIPLTGASKLVAASAVTKREAASTTLVGSAWTWVTCEFDSTSSYLFSQADHYSPTPASFIAPVVVEQVATGPSLASHRLLAARPTPRPVVSLITAGIVGPTIAPKPAAAPVPVRRPLGPLRKHRRYLQPGEWEAMCRDAAEIEAAKIAGTFMDQPSLPLTEDGEVDWWLGDPQDPDRKSVV